MKINVKSIKFTAKDHLKEYVHEKVSKLLRFDDKIISAEVSLQMEDGVINNKSCIIRLVVPGNDLIAKKAGDSFEEAVLGTVDTMQNILQRRKEKMAHLPHDKSAMIGS